MDDSSISTRCPARYLWIALGVQALLFATIGALVGTHAWDDGAITLAYSRTFAQTGRIALTAASEQVEGASSVAWFLLNALVALFHPSFEGAILTAQILSGIFLGLATLFIWLIARHLRLRSRTTLAILTIFSLLGPSISEVANGMEMTLLTASGLALVYSLYVVENRRLLTVAVIVFLTTRFEAMIYYAFILLPQLLRKQFKSFVVLSLLGLATVGLQEYARYSIVGDIVPNTIRAKMHLPYHLTGVDALVSRLKAVFEPIHVLLPILMGIGGLLLFATISPAARLRRILGRNDQLVVLSMPIIAVLFFSLLTGQNWGYVGRMQFLLFPFALLLSGWVFDELAGALPAFKSSTALVGIAVIGIIFSWTTYNTASPLDAIAWSLRHRGEAAERFGVTPASFRMTGLAVDKLRRILGLPTIVVMTPDVGGLALCCDRIRVVDSGLLTNRRLANEGYGALSSVIAEEKPEIIQTHADWAVFSRIYDNPAFIRDYQPILIDATRLYVRNDVADLLVRSGKADRCPLSRLECLQKALQTHRHVEYVYRSDDVAFLKTGAFVELVEPTPSL